MRQSVSKITIAVLGASGTTGRLVVARAIQSGHDVVALVRRTGTFSPVGGLREEVWRDVSEVESLSASLRGADAVISALGGSDAGPTTVCADAARGLVLAMGASDVDRLVVVSAHGVLETHDRSLYSRAVWAGVAEKMKDKETMEGIIAPSDLAWTIVRPPALKNTPATGAYRTGTGLPIRLWHSIGRADLADFLVREVETPSFVHRYPRIRG
jgi:putative NADH-flavin reductase